MSPRFYALFVAAALLAAFLAANSLADVALRGARLDLTEDRLYTLSPGTRQVIGDLAEPIDLTFYFSRDASARYPAIRTYAARVREMLQSYAGRSRGKVRIHEVDPARFTEREDAATAAGIKAIAPEEGGDPIYLGLTGSNAVDERETIPTLAPAREPFLEYEITRLISELDTPRKLNVAVITTLPLDAEAARDPEHAAEQPLFFTELARAAEIHVLPRDFTVIPPDSAVLAILQPWALTPAQLYAVDQFLMTDGRALIALDPAAIGWEAAGLGAPSVAPSANLDPLFARWGVSLSQDVVMDGQRALEVQGVDASGRAAIVPQPLYFKALAEQMSRDDLVTAGLRRQINFGAPGGFSWRPVDGVSVAPLIATTRSTMRMPALQALMRPSPQDVAARFAPSGRIETLALRVSGFVRSAFPAAPPGAAAAAAHVARSRKPVDVVFVSDVDFLNDGFYVAQGRQPFADNGAFALNAIDMLAGADALVSLRSRAPSARPLALIESMEAQAATRLAKSQSKLRDELAEADARLAALQDKGRGSGFFTGDLGAELTAEEREEVARFRARALKIRAELRATEREYRRDVGRLEGWIMAINVGFIPLLVAAAGLVVSWRRARGRADRR
jgi:ABC-type uncharacterized transport system involved in gliding motility auxiliary subunit